MCAQSVSFIHSLDEPRFLNLLEDSFEHFQECKISVAYASRQAFDGLSDRISSFLRRNGRLKFLADVQRVFTDVDLIEELATIPGDCECKVYCGSSGPASSRARPFHAKVFYFREGRRCRAITGSANFTCGGLIENIEAGTIVEGSSNNSFMKDVLGFWGKMWEYEGTIYPTSDFLDKYRIAAKRFERAAAKREHEFACQVGGIIAGEIVRSRSESGAGIAYLLGLIAGHGEFRGDVTSFIIRRKSSKRRHGGTAGVIAAPGITDYSIKQAEAIATDARRIRGYLNTLLPIDKNGTAEIESLEDFSFSLRITLNPRGLVFRHVQDFIRTGTLYKGDFYPNRLPSLVRKSSEPSVSLNFIRGYFDARGRISAADRLPKEKIRIALSVSPRIDSFGQELLKLIIKQFGVSMAQWNYERGEPRGRESLIRINAEAIPAEFFRSDWQSRFHREFASFNKRKISR